MVVEEITYKTYDDEVITEKFYFNLNEAEIAELELDMPGGLMNYIDTIRKSKNKSEIIRIFKKLLMRAYGIKSPDSKRLIKSDEISLAFTQTEAYNELFKKLVHNDISIADFIFGILPSDWTKEAKNNPEVQKIIAELPAAKTEVGGNA